jgi:hypothetical protein
VRSSTVKRERACEARGNGIWNSGVDQGRDNIVGATIAESLHLVMWRSRADSAPASQLSFFRLSVERAQAGEGQQKSRLDLP